MSHLPERKEKNCLNCGTHVFGRFCHVCGQENVEPKENIWHIISHFFSDITHFDGKIYKSLKLLVLKPGFLSREYLAGRRADYLHPIRMYLFISAIFFLIFFSLFKIDEKSVNAGPVINDKSAEEINKMDSASFSEFTKTINGKAMSKDEFKGYVDKQRDFKIHLASGDYKSRKEYDSLLKAGVKKHNWFERQLVYKNIELNEKYKSNPGLMMVNLLQQFIHTLPQMLFILLPLFAAVLRLIYIRRRQFYYVDHAIFTLHLYIFIFLAMLVIFGINKLEDLLHWDWLGYVRGILILSILFYFYKALRNFYRQRRAKTIVKFVILLFSFSFINVILFAFFFLFSLFRI